MHGETVEKKRFQKFQNTKFHEKLLVFFCELYMSIDIGRETDRQGKLLGAIVQISL
jgi:hypothetical protein